MSKLFKSIVSGISAIAMIAWGVPGWAVVDDSEKITITVSRASSFDLTVSYLESADGKSGTGTLGFDFTSLDLTLPETYWAVSDKCLLVEYSSNYSWGVRIVTDNRDLINSSDSSSVTLSDYIAGNDIGGGVLAYSGLVASSDLDSETTDEDPTARAALAWQAYDEWAVTYQSYLPTSSLVKSDSGYYIDDDNVGDAWTAYDDWHYIGDKSDTGFTDAIYDSDGDLTYPMVAIGVSGDYGSLIPATGGNGIDTATAGKMIDLADGDVVIFIATRFASTNWDDITTPVPYLLEPDTYSTSLYIELIHE